MCNQLEGAQGADRQPGLRFMGEYLPLLTVLFAWDAHGSAVVVVPDAHAVHRLCVNLPTCTTWSRRLATVRGTMRYEHRVREGLAITT